MVHLLAVAYPEPNRASEVLADVRRLHEAALADLDDAVYVTRGITGTVELHQRVGLAGTSNTDAAGLGLLVTLLFSVPLLGGVVGTAVATIGGDLTSLGVGDQFVADLDAAMPPESSAIVALVHDQRLGGVLLALGPFGGTPLHTPLSRGAKARLRAAARAARR